MFGKHSEENVTNIVWNSNEKVQSSYLSNRYDCGTSFEVLYTTELSSFISKLISFYSNPFMALANETIYTESKASTISVILHVELLFLHEHLH